jgi:prephenate dehydratase
VRAVAEGEVLAGASPHAAIGTRHAAELYGAIVLAEGIEDDAENATRFAWIARRDAATPDATASSPGGAGPTKTALVFWGAGDRAPGWLVACLSEFASREINLTRIESRPRRIGLGHYMFFCDLVGHLEDPAVADAVAGVRAHCEELRVLGSFPSAVPF